MVMLNCSIQIIAPKRHPNVRATTAISDLTGVSRPRGGCSGLFSENESSRVESHAHVRCQQVNSAAHEKQIRN
jgi:hypothetical protein